MYAQVDPVLTIAFFEKPVKVLRIAKLAYLKGIRQRKFVKRLRK
jgi:hypothetical protein